METRYEVFVHWCGQKMTVAETLNREDAQYFVERCKARGVKATVRLVRA